MSNDRHHDDGLVHAHRWAREPAQRPMPRIIPAPREEHDEGLVHGHGWACGERGRPVHG
jgi:hypothetical protein